MGKKRLLIFSVRIDSGERPAYHALHSGFVKQWSVENWEWNNLLPALKKRFPGMIQGIILDKTGQAIPEYSDVRPPKQLIQRFYNGYQRLIYDRTPSRRSTSLLLKVFLAD
ncbi:MAG: hypothetical protein WA705_02220 [Candidatus Ozemobacteraceae bacterium]